MVKLSQADAYIWTLNIQSELLRYKRLFSEAKSMINILFNPVLVENKTVGNSDIWMQFIACKQDLYTNFQNNL